METGKVYNGVKIDTTDGMTITRTDQKAKVLLNATSGIKLQKGDGVGGFTDSLFADSDGNLTLAGKVVIGTGNSIFKADTNGIYLGSSAFNSAPFKVDLSGKLTATNAAIKGNIECTGLTIAGTDVLDKVSTLSSSISGKTLTTGVGGITKISGNIEMGAGSSISWGNINTPDYSQIGGYKPPSNADNTSSNIVSAVTGAFTYIERNRIYSPTIVGGTLESTSSGKSIKLDANSGKISIGNGLNEIGTLDYNIESGNGDSDKIYLTSSGALKLQAHNGISLHTGNDGTLWVYGDIRLNKNGAQILDINGIPITGASGIAKFG